MSKATPSIQSGTTPSPQETRSGYSANCPNRTDDIVMYDVPEPIQVTGIEAYKETWKLFFDHNAAGSDRFRLSDVQIVASDDVAYAHGLLTIGGGDAHCRLTLGLRRTDGEWKVTHEHHSIPIKLD
ncbi:nuclear transport factor 2 family protein [Pararhizobium sp. LjRoot238]|uniref:nuclear transport factor 2 family protein n=1 Tax=Pararhizobium sp. LjRoot238 TaxID=3342293 RepID=UPI003F5049AD